MREEFRKKKKEKRTKLFPDKNTGNRKECNKRARDVKERGELEIFSLAVRSRRDQAGFSL